MQKLSRRELFTRISRFGHDAQGRVTNSFDRCNRAGVIYVADLLIRTEAELSDIRGIGTRSRSMQAIRSYMTERELPFRPADHSMASRMRELFPSPMQAPVTFIYAVTPERPHPSAFRALQAARVKTVGDLPLHDGYRLAAAMGKCTNQAPDSPVVQEIVSRLRNFFALMQI